MPELLPVNNEAILVFSLTRGQVITAGMGDVIGLNFMAVDFIMNLYGIEDRRRVFEKVLVAFDHVLKRSKET